MAEIETYFGSIFSSDENFKICFRDLLTVRESTCRLSNENNIFGLFIYHSFTNSTMFLGKVEKILKCNLDSIPSPSPSVKIQIMG
jgi:hypothetical protein